MFMMTEYSKIRIQFIQFIVNKLKIISGKLYFRCPGIFSSLVAIPCTYQGYCYAGLLNRPSYYKLTKSCIPAFGKWFQLIKECIDFFYAFIRVEDIALPGISFIK